MQNFFGVLKDNVAQKIKEKVGTEDVAEKPVWYSHRFVSPSARQMRRLRDRDINRQTRWFRRLQASVERNQARDNDRVLVRVLTAFEKDYGLEPGGLRRTLIEDGKLRGTRDKIVGWENVTMPTPDGPVEARRPIVKKVPIGHTYAEILEAAGLDAKTIQEVNQTLEIQANA